MILNDFFSHSIPFPHSLHVLKYAKIMQKSPLIHHHNHSSSLQTMAIQSHPTFIPPLLISSDEFAKKSIFLVSIILFVNAP